MGGEHHPMLASRRLPGAPPTERLADPVYALVLLCAGACFGIVATLLVFTIAVGRVF